MNKAEYSGIWVYVETEGESVKNVGLELIGAARALADATGETLTAVVMEPDPQRFAPTILEYGPDRLLLADCPRCGPFESDACCEAMTRLASKYRPSTILVGATDHGRDFAPRVACRLRTGLTADCTGLHIDGESGDVAWTRPAFGGNLMATILCPDTRPQMGTVRPGVYKRIPARCETEILRETILLEEEAVRVRVREVLQSAARKIDLSAAQIIVSGGRGLGGPEHFALIEALAEALGGEVGASRAAVDAGWIDGARQVGQTGTTVSPRLYIACGISGAVQHQVGMSGSELIVAINADPDAPIFDIADFCLVGDLFELVPALTAAVREGVGQ